jgi:ketosteroid isomerase-like protein
MSEENVELVRAGYEAFNRRDFDAALALAHDAITWRPLFSVETEVLRGVQEIRAAWERQTEALDVRVDILELTPLDETRVLAVGKWTGRGAESGVAVEQTATQVFAVEGGRIRGVETYASKDAALRAAGLPEEPERPAQG